MGWKSWFMPITTIIATYFVNGITEAIGNKVLMSFLPIPDYLIKILQYAGPTAKKFAKRSTIIFGVIDAIIVFLSNIGFLWLANLIILTIGIFIECGKVKLGVAAKNALAGSLAASIALLVWHIITIIPALGQLLTSIEVFLFFLPLLILVIFNLSFGAIGNAVALSQGCSEGFDGDTLDSESAPGSHSHSHAGYGPYDRCRCMCCPVCNKIG